VWDILLKIPYGKTISYLELSKQLGDVKAIRAVSNANGKNPLWIIIPCHRVIGTDGSLTGYAGGLHRKQWLLEHENPYKQQTLF
jgi:methylated-DNA-[protein]-cysteine S-methyltransferase